MTLTSVLERFVIKKRQPTSQRRLNKPSARVTIIDDLRQRQPEPRLNTHPTQAELLVSNARFLREPSTLPPLEPHQVHEVFENVFLRNHDRRYS